jgi:hypothetical protein
MAHKRIFVAFAMEDVDVKILFTGQAKNKKVPYDFVDMSVKQPWDSQWKINCRTKIKGCDGAFILVSENLKKATGALWEIDCIKEEKIPVAGIYISNGTFWDKPDSLFWIDCKEWSWGNIKIFIDSL